MKYYTCTDCKKEKLAKDFPNMWRAEKDRPWRYCTACVQKHYHKGAARFSQEDVDSAVKAFSNEDTAVD